MVKLGVVLACFSAFFIFVVARPEDKIVKAKISVVARELATIGDDIRKIAIKTPRDQVQFASIVSDLIGSFGNVQKYLNQMIPNVVGQEGHDMLTFAAIQASTYSHNLQNCLAASPEKLKEVLVNQLEDAKTTAKRFFDNFKVANEFVDNQLKRVTDMFILTMFKLKSQVGLFDKTNKEVVHGLSDRVVEFNDAIKSLPSTVNATKLELRHALHHLAEVLEQNIYKLENWAEVNSNNNDDVKIAHEVSNVFSALFDKLIRGTNEKNETPELKVHLIEAVEVVVKNVVRLGQINYLDNFGGQEFIRSGIFDVVSFGKAYIDNIKALQL